MKKRKLWPVFRMFAAIAILFCWGAAFSGVYPAMAKIFRNLALIPALLTAGGWIVILLILTLLSGRFYCSLCCPLGILQDLLALVSFRKTRKSADLFKLRLAVTGGALGAAASGSAAVVMIFDPYSNFGRIVGNFSVISGAALLLIMMLTFFRKRLFCNSVCPAGTVLGAVSHFPVIRLALKDNCVKCGLCAGNCPASCIDPASGKVDNERCLRCLKCISVCPLPESGIGFRRIRKGDLDLSRRKFLINGGILLGAAAAGAALAKIGMQKLWSYMPRFKVLPPGAGNLERFAAKCTACQLCVKNCPAQIIVPAENVLGPVSLDLSRGNCRFKCRRCSQVCPTGAIVRHSLAQKQRTAIALAEIDADSCIGCGNCEDNCPLQAVAIPDIDPGKCIGCGKCFHLCPVKAITIKPRAEQIILKPVAGEPR